MNGFCSLYYYVTLLIPVPIVSHKHLTIPSDLRQLKTVRDAVLELAKPCLSAQAHLVVLAVDEAVSNVMRHAFAADNAADNNNGTASASGSNGPGATGPHEIDVDIDAGGGRLEVCIADNGPAYNPCDARAETAQDRVLARKRGGMGLSIMRDVMDEIRYDRTLTHRNELKLIKYFDPKPIDVDTVTT